MQSCGGEAPPDSSRYAGNAEQELDSELEELGEAGFHQQIVMQLKLFEVKTQRPSDEKVSSDTLEELVHSETVRV